MRTLLPILLIFLGLVVSSPAAKAPMSAKELAQDATRIVEGEVTEVTSRKQKSRYEKGWFNTDRVFTITVKVAKHIKGPGKDDVLVFSAWQPARRTLALPGLQGHYNIPKVGARIRVHVFDTIEGLYALHPNGIQPRPTGPELAPKSSVEQD